MDPRVQLRVEVKLAQKKFDRAESQRKVLENKVRSALNLGERDLATRMATRLNEARRECDDAELQLKQCQHMERVGRRDLSDFKNDLKRAEQLQVLSKANQQMASALDKVSDDGAGRVANEMTQKLEEQAAYNEAKLDLAVEDAEAKTPGLDLQKAEQEMAAEDLLRQIELNMNINPDY